MNYLETEYDKQIDPQLISKEQVQLIKQTLDTNNIVNGRWDNNLLIWKYTLESRSTIILNQLHEILDPDNKLTRTVTKTNIWDLYHNIRNCKDNIITIDSIIKGMNCTCSDKRKIFNYIEIYVLLAKRNAITVHLLNSQPDVICTKLGLIDSDGYNLYLTKRRTKNMPCHTFVDYEIKQADIETYNPDTIDPFLLELVDGNIESYVCFMHLFVAIHKRFRSNPVYLVIHCNDNTNTLITNMFTQLYGRFIRHSNNHDDFLPRISIKHINTHNQRVGLVYHSCVLIGQSKYIDTMRLYRNNRWTLTHINTRDLGTEQFPHSSIVKIILDVASHKYDITHKQTHKQTQK